MKERQKTTDEFAISIRSLWHIDSMEEKKRIIDNVYEISKVFLLAKEKPELFSQEELEKIANFKAELTPECQKLYAEVTLKKHLPFIDEPPEYTVEAVKEFYETGRYFTKAEIEEIIEWQFVCSEDKHDPELVILLAEYLEKHLYFDTIEEAEQAEDEYERKMAQLN